MVGSTIFALDQLEKGLNPIKLTSAMKSNCKRLSYDCLVGMPMPMGWKERFDQRATDCEAMNLMLKNGDIDGFVQLSNDQIFRANDFLDAMKSARKRHQSQT